LCLVRRFRLVFRPPRRAQQPSSENDAHGAAWPSASQQCARGPCQKRDDQVAPRRTGAGLAPMRSRPLAPGLGVRWSLGIGERKFGCGFWRRLRARYDQRTAGREDGRASQSEPPGKFHIRPPSNIEICVLGVRVVAKLNSSLRITSSNPASKGIPVGGDTNVGIAYSAGGSCRVLGSRRWEND